MLLKLSPEMLADLDVVARTMWRSVCVQCGESKWQETKILMKRSIASAMYIASQRTDPILPAMVEIMKQANELTMNRNPNPIEIAPILFLENELVEQNRFCFPLGKGAFRKEKQAQRSIAIRLHGNKEDISSIPLEYLRSMTTSGVVKALEDAKKEDKGPTDASSILSGIKEGLITSYYNNLTQDERVVEDEENVTILSPQMKAKSDIETGDYWVISIIALAEAREVFNLMISAQETQ